MFLYFSKLSAMVVCHFYNQKTHIISFSSFLCLLHLQSGLDSRKKAAVHALKGWQNWSPMGPEQSPAVQMGKTGHHVWRVTRPHTGHRIAARFDIKTLSLLEPRLSQYQRKITLQGIWDPMCRSLDPKQLSISYNTKGWVGEHTTCSAICEGIL